MARVWCKSHNLCKTPRRRAYHYTRKWGKAPKLSGIAQTSRSGCGDAGKS
jgi:hypothetical protein